MTSDSSALAMAPQAATVLVVDDILANRNLLRETLEPQGYEVLLAADGETALRVALRAQPDVILLDVMMPGWSGFETCRRLKQAESTRHIPILFISALDETKSMVEGFRAGGVDYITKPFQTEEVLVRVRTHLENACLTQTIVEKNRQLEAANAQLRAEIVRREQAEASFEAVDEQLSLISQREAERWGIPALIGASSGLAYIVESVRKLQPLPKVTVLIEGESGTGKELIARAIHFGGPRAKGPFLSVNCPAVPAELAESLFFGHTKGAFSGAVTDRKGYFENAQGGTLFLDEIGDMPLALQAKLLRVLENGRVLPVGAAGERVVDVRIIAATNADLQAEIQTGRFREDLYFRLAHFVALVPPLRDRKEDLTPLVEHFLSLLSSEMGLAKPRLLAGAWTALQAYDYPGNVRELKNLIERALIESGGGDIAREHLHFAYPQRRPGGDLDRRGASGSALPTEAWETDPAAARPAIEEDEARILTYVREHGMINNAECRQLLAVGIHRAWYLLRKLHRSGQLIQDSSRRWAQYRLP